MPDTKDTKKAQTNPVPSDTKDTKDTQVTKAAEKLTVAKEPAKEAPKAEKAPAKAADKAEKADKSAKAEKTEKPAKAEKAPAKASAKAPAKKAAPKAKKTVDTAIKNGVRAQVKYIRVAPRKARLVVDLIRNKSVEQANEILQFSTRAVATDVEKVLRSACANAYQNNGLRTEDLVISEAYVDEGPTLKRIRPRAKGSASRINKRTSHITVVVAPRKEARA